MKNIIGIWISGMQDEEQEVIKAAKDSFNTAFPINKRLEVIKVYEEEILKYVKGVLLQNKQEFEENSYERIISSNILSMNYLIENLKEESKSNQYEEIMSPQFFKLIVVKEDSKIRGAMYQLIQTLCLYKKDEVKKNMKILSPYIIGCFSEKDPYVHKIMIGTLITFLKEFHETCWESVNLQKAIFPKLFIFLSQPENSSPNITFNILLPFLNFFNFKILGTLKIKKRRK
jgi:hypothetical protein